MGNKDLGQMVADLEKMAGELEERASVIDKRADALDARRDAFSANISSSLEALRRSAGLPAKRTRIR